MNLERQGPRKSKSDPALAQRETSKPQLPAFPLTYRTLVPLHCRCHAVKWPLQGISFFAHLWNCQDVVMMSSRQGPVATHSRVQTPFIFPSVGYNICITQKVGMSDCGAACLGLEDVMTSGVWSDVCTVHCLPREFCPHYLYIYSSESHSILFHRSCQSVSQSHIYPEHLPLQLKPFSLEFINPSSKPP